MDIKEKCTQGVRQASHAISTCMRCSGSAVCKQLAGMKLAFAAVHLLESAQELSRHSRMVLPRAIDGHRSQPRHLLVCMDSDQVLQYHLITVKPSL